MERQSTLSRLHQRRSYRVTIGRASLLFIFLISVVALDALILQAQSAAMRSRTPEQQRQVDVTSDESPGGNNQADKERNRLSPPTTASQPSAQGAARQTNLPTNTAIVTWNSQGLEVEAWNSSLNQILQDVAAKTGARLEGLTRDQRIFGTYGPGPGYDVLSKLLEGSGYNMLMFGSHDARPPLTIVLSVRLPISPHTSTNGQTRRYAESIEPIEPGPPAPASSVANQDPYNTGGPPRDPVQFMQEVLQRQQLIDQQQHDEHTQPP